MEKKKRICLDCNISPSHNNSKYCWTCRETREIKYRQEYSHKQKQRNKVWYSSLSPEEKKALFQKRYQKYKKVIYDERGKTW